MPFLAEAITAKPARAPRRRSATRACAVNVVVLACRPKTPGPSASLPPAIRTSGRGPTGHCHSWSSRRSKSTRTGCGLVVADPAGSTTGQPSGPKRSCAIMSCRLEGSPRA
jgi:hypothetical protein